MHQRDQTKREAGYCPTVNTLPDEVVKPLSIGLLPAQILGHSHTRLFLELI